MPRQPRPPGIRELRGSLAPRGSRSLDAGLRRPFWFALSASHDWFWPPWLCGSPLGVRLRLRGFCSFRSSALLLFGLPASGRVNVDASPQAQRQLARAVSGQQQARAAPRLASCVLLRLPLAPADWRWPVEAGPAQSTSEPAANCCHWPEHQAQSRGSPPATGPQPAAVAQGGKARWRYGGLNCR